MRKENLLISACLILLLCVLLIINEPLTGTILTVIVVVVIAIGMIREFYQHNKDRDTINRIYQRFDELNKKQINDLPIASVIIDKDEKIVWYNRKFDEDFLPEALEEPAAGEPLKSFVQVDYDQARTNPDYVYSTDDQDFHVHVQALVEEDHPIKILSFNDITAIKRQEEMYRKYEPVFCYIMIDNYDEVIDTLSTPEKSSILSQIELKITDWAKRKDAFILNYEVDRFLVIFDRSKLQIMEKGRFHILDEIREIPTGHPTQITLSIGVGVSSEPVTIQDADALSHSALEIALARGGDQAVVKKDDTLEFYGGTTEATEKRTKVKARVKAFGLKEFISEADNVLIMGHKTPDMDAIGSAIGLTNVCSKMGKDARIVLSNINFSIKAMTEYLAASNEYNDVFVTPKEAEEFIKPNTLLIVVDTQNGSYVEVPELLDMVNNRIVIDHHRRSGKRIEAVLEYCEVYASSTCELITELVQYFGDKNTIDSVAANALMAGLFMDTKMFTVKTGVRTFEAASYLKRRGGNTITAKSMLQEDLTTYGLKARAVQAAKVYHDVIAVSTFEDESEYAKIIAAQAADELLNIKGIEASFIILKNEGAISISGRSSGNINVQVILEKLGGGGHLAMAGAQPETSSLSEAKTMLLEAIDQYMGENS